MNEHSNKVVLASAGTGKTYSLTNQYLRLLFLNEDPGKILATTFTRKAAGEIRDRVFERLVESITDSDKRAELSVEIGVPLNEEQCRGKLAEFVQRLDQIQISTIDGFFNRLINLFSHDLGLPTQWGIIKGARQDEQTIEALSLMMQEEGLTRVTEMIEGLNRLGDKGVYQEFLRVVNTMRPVFLESKPEAWDCVTPPHPPSSEDVADAITTLEEFNEIPLNQNGSPNRHWEKAIGKIRELLPDARRTGDWEPIIAVGPAKKAIEGVEEFSRKEIPEAFAIAVKVLGSATAHTLAVKIQKRNLAIRQLLERLETELEELKRRNSNYTFSDLPLLLAQNSLTNEENNKAGLDFSYRLGTGIEHLLLDEFQDTNPLQWRVLQHFAQKILATPERGSFYCVGDVKQSIYTWRQGEPRLLESMKELYPQLESETLSVSYRSSPVILETANTVFVNLIETIDELSNSDPNWVKGAQLWTMNYPEHESADHLQDSLGATYLVEARSKEENGGESDPVLERLVERLLALTEKSASISVGVLTRTNKPISSIIDRLQSSGLKASGEGGNAITDSLAILQLLSILHFADHPGDTAALHAANTAPLWPTHLFENITKENEVLASVIRERILEEGYGKFIASLLPKVQDHESYGDWDLRRFNQLIDLAFSFDIENTSSRISDFVTYIQNTTVENPDTAGIRVMTVHAAKGLEFDAVFIPELSEKLDGKPPQIYAERPNPENFYERVSTSPKKDHRALIGGALEALHQDHLVRQLQDAFCVLYVAITRARYHLEMIVEAPPKTESTSKNFQQLLRKSFTLTPPDDHGIIWQHPHSDPEWANVLERPTDDDTDIVIYDPSVPLLPITSDCRHLPRRSPSDHFGARGIRIDEMFNVSTGGALRGEIFHRLFEEINWLEEFEVQDDDLLHTLEKFDVPEETLRQYVEEFRLSLREGNVVKYLTRANQPDTIQGTPVKWEAWRERRFCISLENDDGTETLWNGIIDRVNVATDSSGKYVGATLLDYKTDAVTVETLAGKAKTYQPQLLTYRKVLNAITEIDEREIETGLLFLGSDMYIPVDSI